MKNALRFNITFASCSLVTSAPTSSAQESASRTSIPPLIAGRADHSARCAKLLPRLKTSAMKTFDFQLFHLSHTSEAANCHKKYCTMPKPIIARSLGGLATALTVAATAFNLIFAASLTDATPAIQLLAFVAFAVNLLVIATLIFLATYYVAKLKPDPIELPTRLCWRFIAMGIVVTIVSMPLSLITLISLTRALKHLPRRIVNQPVDTMLIAWFALWGVSVLLRIAFFAFTVVWTKGVLQTRGADQENLDLDFGITLPAMVEARPDTQGTMRSFQSQENTLASPPKTPPTSRPKSSLRSSSSTKVGPGSSRTKLIQDSAKSSFDFPVDDGFDRWDTSSVHQEVRATLQSSPSLTRSGLETIPGSRPESPANALDGPFLPSSPSAANSDATTAVGWLPGSSRKASSSSPPSSPPNFSRPTSSQRNKAGVHSTMEELVHPLFRTSSPSPAPVAAPGTMITASPMAGQSITPRAVSRMRSGTFPQNSSTSLSASNAPSSDGSAPGSPEMGSPGPSIIEEEDLPPILPGFVLSAGQRSSLVGYGKRKSVKERPSSSHSQQRQMVGGMI
jgi:hypothetical protein